MFAHDLKLLPAPEIHVDDIPKIDDRSTLETAMLIKALIPPSER